MTSLCSNEFSDVVSLRSWIVVSELGGSPPTARTKQANRLIHPAKKVYPACRPLGSRCMLFPFRLLQRHLLFDARQLTSLHGFLEFSVEFLLDNLPLSIYADNAALSLLFSINLMKRGCVAQDAYHVSFPKGVASFNQLKCHHFRVRCRYVRIILDWPQVRTLYRTCGNVRLLIVLTVIFFSPLSLVFLIRVLTVVPVSRELQDCWGRSYRTAMMRWDLMSTSQAHFPTGNYLKKNTVRAMSFTLYVCDSRSSTKIRFTIASIRHLSCFVDKQPTRLGSFCRWINVDPQYLEIHYYRALIEYYLK